jgi:glycosyltransferase involved in cell wall biosynthesis
MTVEKLHVIYLYADRESEWNCSHWRCHLLSNGINYAHNQNPEAFPHTAKMYELTSAMDFHNPTVQKLIGAADIVVFQRNVLWEGVWDALDYWRALGKVCVVDLDDHYPMIPPSNPAFQSWILNTGKMDPDPIERLKHGLSKADALIAPSKVILKDWEHLIPGYYWPNYPSLVDWKDVTRKPPGGADVIVTSRKDGSPNFQIRPDSEGKIVIGWGGSLSHIDSFVYSGVIEGLAMLMEENKNVVFKFCGNDNRMQFLLDRLPEEQVYRQVGVTAKDWPYVVSTFDIGIAPMDMRPVPSNTGNEHGEYSYDERRSWLKLVEYACGGVPFVATDCAAYDDLARHGKMVENTPEAWYEALKSRVDNLPHFYKEALSTRKNNLKRLTIENNAQRLIDFYFQIGEEAQANQGMVFPNMMAIAENPEAEWAGPNPILYEGDPLQIGRADYADSVIDMAGRWYKDLGLFYKDWDMGDILEYPMLTLMNVQLGKELPDVD